MLADEHDQTIRLPRWLALLPVLLLACGCPKQGMAQIAIKESKQAYWSFPNAQVIDGQVVAPVASVPKLDRVETSIRVETVVEYKFGQLKARRLPSYERVTLDEVSKGVYKFKAGAPEGHYLLEYSAFDPDKGIASDEATITLERGPSVEPVPVPTPQPSTNDTERIVEIAMFELRKGYGSTFRRTAEAIDAKQFDTDSALVKFMNPLTEANRKSALAGIDGLLQDKLPRDGNKLKPEAAGFFREIAAAFERGIK